MLPDLVQNDNLEEFLLSNECPLLANILTELQQFNPTKWNDIPLSFLYPQLLTDAQELMKMVYSERTYNYCNGNALFHWQMLVQQHIPESRKLQCYCGCFWW